MLDHMAMYKHDRVYRDLYSSVQVEEGSLRFHACETHGLVRRGEEPTTGVHRATGTRIM